MSYFSLIKETLRSYNKEKVSVWSASLAYFTLFSLSPLLLLLTTMAGIFWGEQAIRGELFEQIKELVGNDSAELIQNAVSKTTSPSGNTISTIIGIITLLLGATGIFGQLQQAFNAIWHVKANPNVGIRRFIKDRIISFSMLLIIAFLIAISVGISFFTSTATNYVNTLFTIPLLILDAVNTIISFLLLTALFGAMFKILPDIKISFKTVLPGAVLASLLFVIGKFIISWYIGRSAYTSTYGAAGSVMILLVWVYYSVQILLLGSVFTKAYARLKNIKITPSKNAVSTEPTNNKKKK